MSDPDDPLSSNPDRLRRLADELEHEGQLGLAQATRRAADSADRDRQSNLDRQEEESELRG